MTATQGEEQGSGLALEQDAAHLVHDEQGDPPQALELLVDPAGPLGRGNFPIHSWAVAKATR